MNPTPATRFAVLALAVVPLATPLTAAAYAQAALPSGESRETIGIALADTPPEARTDPRANRYIVGHLPAGATATRRLEVSNDTGSTQRIEVYAGPATVHGGRFLPTDPGATSDLTRWITVDQPVVHVPPHSTAEVVATISAPRGAPSEEHYGVIWASHTSRGPAAAPGGASTGPAGLDAISRVGVRVYLSTGEERPPGPDFEIVDLRPIRDALGVAAVVATVANIGGRAVDIAGTLALIDGPGGLSSPPVPADPVTIGPGETADVPFSLPSGSELPPGEWRASVALSSGAVQREAAEAVNLAPTDDQSASASTPTDRALSADRFLVPGLALVALVLFATGVRAVARRRPRAARPELHTIDY